MSEGQNASKILCCAVIAIEGIWCRIHSQEGYSASMHNTRSLTDRMTGDEALVGVKRLHPACRL
jgi:hypothetical protein